MFNDFINSLRTAWDYKYHNTQNNTVEPFPTGKRPSDIYKRINPNPSPDKKEYLYHADTLFRFGKLGKEFPYQVTVEHESPKPFMVAVYAKNKSAAKKIGMNKFINYLKNSNSKYSSYSLVYDLIKKGFINLSVREI